MSIATIQDVADYLHMSWHTIKQIDKEYLNKHFSKPPLQDVRYIGIDEFAVKKGHQYNTIVVDLQSGHVIYVGEGHKKESLSLFWKRLKSSGAQVKAVAIDMWPAFIESVKENLPNADIVFDHFHIIKNLNTTLDEVRKGLYREEKELNKKDVIKGTRWLLLKNSENLSSKQNDDLYEVLKMNQPLAACYYLKEELRLLWSCTSVKQAEIFLDYWVKKAFKTQAFAMYKFANSLLAHRSGILSYFNHHITTAAVEGINNKIKVLKRKAYGYRDNEYFGLKIISMNHIKYAFLR